MCPVILFSLCAELCSYLSFSFSYSFVFCALPWWFQFFFTVSRSIHHFDFFFFLNFLAHLFSVCFHVRCFGLFFTLILRLVPIAHANIFTYIALGMYCEYIEKAHRQMERNIFRIRVWIRFVIVGASFRLSTVFAPLKNSMFENFVVTTNTTVTN